TEQISRTQKKKLEIFILIYQKQKYLHKNRGRGSALRQLFLGNRNETAINFYINLSNSSREEANRSSSTNLTLGLQNPPHKLIHLLISNKLSDREFDNMYSILFLLVIFLLP
ncbi:hypothetical protein OWV82_013975, partial [Melia azedarach]